MPEIDERLKLFESVARSQGFPEEEIAPFLEFGRLKIQEPDIVTQRELAREARGEVREAEEEAREARAEARKFRRVGGEIKNLSPEAFSILEEEGFEFPARAPTEFQRVGSIIGNLINEFNLIPESQKGPFQGAIAKRAPFGLAAKATEFEEARAGLAGTLKGIVGEVGRLTDQDIARIINLLPTVTDTREQSDIATKRLNDLIQAIYGKGLEESAGLPAISQRPKKEPTLAPIPQPFRREPDVIPGLSAISAIERLAGEEALKKKTAEGVEVDDKLIRFLADSEFLPIAGSIIGGIAGAGVASLATGAVGAITGKALQQGLRELLDPERQDLSDAGKSVLTEGLVDAVVGGVFLGVGKAGVVVLRKAIKEPLEAVLPKVVRKALPLTKNQLKKFKRAFGTSLTDEIIERGVPKSAQEAVDTAAEASIKARQQLDNILKGKVATVDEVIKVLEDAKPEKISPGIKAGVKKIDDQITFLRESFPKNVPAPAVNTLKRELQEAFGKSLEVPTAAKRVVTGASRKVRKFVEKFDPDIKGTNKELRINKLVRDAGEDILETSKARALLGLDDWIILGGGAVAGQPTVGIGIFTAKKLLLKVAKDPFTQAKLIKGYLEIGQKLGNREIVKRVVQLAMRLGVAFTADIVAPEEEELLPTTPPQLFPAQRLPAQPGLTP